MIFDWLEVQDINVVVILDTDPCCCWLHHDFGTVDYYLGADEHDRYFEGLG